MNDAASMRIFESPGNLVDDLESHFLVDRCATAVQYAGKRSSREPFHDDEVNVFVAIEIDESNDIRMRKAATLGRFLLQRAQCVGIPRKLR